MKQILFLSIFLILWFLPLNTEAQLTTLQQAYNSAVTFYACPSGLGTCTYNGDGGTSATPSDSNDCLTKATPCATVAGVQTKIANKAINAVVTIQLADTTGGTGFLPDAVEFSNVTQGKPFSSSLEFSILGTADKYPTGYIWIRGNDATPNNVNVTGATTAGGTTSSKKSAFVARGSTLRVSGIKLNYFRAADGDTGAINCYNAVCYAEAMNATSDHTGNDGAILGGFYQSTLMIGGAITATNTGIIRANGMSTFQTYSPAGYASVTASHSGAGFLFFANEMSHGFVDGGTHSFTGSGAYRIYVAWAGSTINFNADATTSITVNAASSIMNDARFSSAINEACGSTNVTCTFTSFDRRAVAYDKSSINYGGTTGTGTTGNLQYSASFIQQGTTFPLANMFLPDYTSQERQLVQRYVTAGSQLYHHPNFAFIAHEGTLASPTATQSGHILGSFSFGGYTTGAVYEYGASITGKATGTYSGSNWEGRLVFSTASPGTAGTVDRVIINQNGITSLYQGANVASATALVLTGNVQHVTGTTTITSITTTAITAGTTVTLIFDGVLTFTDGSNLKLAGNFVTTADDVITLAYDGTNFYEIARAVN